MKLIVGLGNPGSKYKATKHNIGFITLDEIAARQNVLFNKHQCEADIAEFFMGTEKILLAKPQTFMNDSGRSIRGLIDYYDLLIDDVVVLYDDLDLSIGFIRLRQKGGSGGHNGIKSLIQHIGSQEFNRIRIGIGRPASSKEVIAYVLSDFPKKAHSKILIGVKTAADAVLFWGEGHSFSDTMNQFNKKEG